MERILFFLHFWVLTRQNAVTLPAENIFSMRLLGAKYRIYASVTACIFDIMRWYSQHIPCS